MQKQPKGPIVLSLLVITVGVGWLLTALGWGLGIHWIWTLGLGVVGILTFVVSGGVDKVSIVVGPFLLAASFLSILRQTGRLSVDIEIPILVITIGVLLLLSHVLPIPNPRWFIPLPAESDSAKSRSTRQH